MKKIFLVVSAILLAIFCINSCDPGPVDVKAEIDSANAIFMEAVNNGDLDALKEVYLPDAIVYPPNSDAIKGVENILPIMMNVSQSGVRMVFESVSAIAYGAIAIDEGTYKVLGPEDFVYEYGKYIVIWEKSGDEWKVSKDIWNSSMPLPEPAPAEEAEEIVEE